MQGISRHAFLKRLGALSVVILMPPPLSIPARVHGLKHPEPRDGITSDKVLTAADLGQRTRKSVIDAYEMARQNPHVFDGLACACGCLGAAEPLHRSLLACYETRQPTGCHGCREQAAFVGKLVQDKKTLAEIRAAVDKEFG